MPAIAGRRIARQLDVDADRGDDGIECSRARDFAFPVSQRAWLPTRRPESNSPIPTHIGTLGRLRCARRRTATGTIEVHRTVVASPDMGTPRVE
jgi:hypothetical protein